MSRISSVLSENGEKARTPFVREQLQPPFSFVLSSPCPLRRGEECVRSPTRSLARSFEAAGGRPRFQTLKRYTSSHEKLFC